MDLNKNRENLLVLVFAAFVFIVILLVAGADHRSDISLGFALGLMFCFALSLIKKKDSNG